MKTASSSPERMLAQRIAALAPSFIREILKVVQQPDIISFAGGLPDPRHFPVAQLKAATVAVFDEEGETALQYGPSEGDLALRQWIAERYAQKQQLAITADEILITNGAQQALDLLGKVLIDAGDGVLIEEPGYLGALQALSLYQPRFLPVPLQQEGPDLEQLERQLTLRLKLFYTTPNFQNPTGLSYSDARRREVAQLLTDRDTLLIEDDPYGDLRFSGVQPLSFRQWLPEQSVLLGSFSKTVAPSLRIGWLVAPPWLMKRLVIAKQAADLHTSGLNQRILAQYLRQHDYAAQVGSIARHYRQQMETMLQAIAYYFPEEVAVTRPEGGMFLWATLNAQQSALQLFERSIAKGVAFVPGHPFYVGRHDGQTLRLNFTNSSAAAIEQGIAAIGQAMREGEC